MSVVNENFDDSYGTVFNMPIGFTVTNGNDLILEAVSDGGAVTGVTDNSSGTPAWTPDGNFTANGVTIYRFKRSAVSGSPTVVNITSSIETFIEGWVFEDDATVDGGTVGDTQYSDTFDTSHVADLDVPNAGDLVILLIDPEFNAHTITAPTGWAMVRSGSVAYDFAYNTSSLSAGVQTATFTLNSADNVYFTPIYYTQGGGSGVTAAGAINLGAIGVAGSASASRFAVGAITLGAIGVAGSGAASRSSTGAINLGPIAVAGAGAASRSASGAINLGAIQVAAAGNSGKSAAGAINLGPIAVAGAATRTAVASGAISLGAIQVAGSGFAARIAEGDIVLGALSVAGSATASRFGSGNISLGPIEVAGAGTVFSGVDAVGAITLGPIEVSGAGQVSIISAGAINLGAIQVAGAGAIDRLASGIITLGAIQVAGFENSEWPVVQGYGVQGISVQGLGVEGFHI